MSVDLIPRSRHSLVDDTGVALPIGLYKVVASGVPCLMQPAADAAVSGQLPKGMLLEADAARGDYVRLSVRDVSLLAGSLFCLSHCPPSLGLRLRHGPSF